MVLLDTLETVELEHTMEVDLGEVLQVARAQDWLVTAQVEVELGSWGKEQAVLLRLRLVVALKEQL